MNVKRADKMTKEKNYYYEETYRWIKKGMNISNIFDNLINIIYVSILVLILGP